MFMKSSKRRLAAVLMAALMLLSLLPGALAVGTENSPMLVSCGNARVGYPSTVQAFVSGATDGQVIFYAAGVPIGSSPLINGSAMIQWTPTDTSVSYIYAEYLNENGNVQFSASSFVSVQPDESQTNQDGSHHTPPGGVPNDGSSYTLPEAGQADPLPDEDPPAPSSQNAPQQNTPPQNTPQQNTQNQQPPSTQESTDTSDVDSLIEILEKQAQQNQQSVGGDETGDGTGSETGDGTGGETGDGTGDETGDGTSDETGDGTGSETGDGTGSETGDGTGSETGDGTGDKIGDGTSSKIGDGTDDETGDGTDDETGDGTGDETGDGTGDETGDGTDDETGDGTGDETGDGTGDETGDGTGDETGDGTGDETGDGIEGSGVSNGLGLMSTLLDISAVSMGTTTTTVTLYTPTVVNLMAGQTINLMAVVAKTDSNNVPTGNVVFQYSNGTVIATASLDNSGVASTTYTIPAAGTYVIKASYPGNNVYAPAVSNNVTVVATGSTNYNVSVQKISGIDGYGVTVTVAVSGPLVLATDTVTLKSGGAVIATRNVNTATNTVAFNVSSVPNGTIHRYTLEYTSTGGSTATTSFGIYNRGGVYTILDSTSGIGMDWDSRWGNWRDWNNRRDWDDWDDWNNWDDWRNWNSSGNWKNRSSQLNLTAEASVSGTTVTITATLTPTNWGSTRGYYSNYNYPVDWYGNQYGRYSNWYSNSNWNNYSTWVSPDGSSYGRTSTQPFWNSTYWGATPQGTVSFYRGSTLLGTAPVYEGVAQFPWTKAPSGTHTIQVVYSGDRNYASASTSVTAQVKSTSSKPSSTSTTSGTSSKTSSGVSTISVTATAAPAQTNVYLRNTQGVVQETYDLSAIEQVNGDILLETTKALSLYKYGIPLMEMRNLARSGQGRIILAAPSFNCSIPYSLANNLTDLNGYLLRSNLSESKVEIRLDIELIQNAALVSAYQRANPDSTGTPTFYRVDIGLNDLNGRKLDFNPGKLEVPLYLVIPDLDFSSAQRYDEQTGVFYPASVDSTTELPILTVDQGGIYVLTKEPPSSVF